MCRHVFVRKVLSACKNCARYPSDFYGRALGTTRSIFHNRREKTNLYYCLERLLHRHDEAVHDVILRFRVFCPMWKLKIGADSARGMYFTRWPCASTSSA